jgi:hypothetical protein
MAASHSSEYVLTGAYLAFGMVMKGLPCTSNTRSDGSSAKKAV